MEENKKDVLPLEGEPLTTPQISEPVVNALAAALNKIETYVPTQYINDGPPDIDAEHLNHAEQAIMRVTNLANGAADAISALQSQVTQLNSDMSKFDIYHRDVTGNLNEDETIQNALEDFKNTVVSNKPILVEIQNHLGGRALAVGIQSGINYNSFLVITYYDRPKEFVYAGNHWQAWRVISTLGMEYGTTDMNRTPGQVTMKHITFQNRLSAFPKVFVCPHTKSPDDTTVSASEATYDGFDIYCYSKAAKEPLAISWMAWY